MLFCQLEVAFKCKPPPNASCSWDKEIGNIGQHNLPSNVQRALDWKEVQTSQSQKNHFFSSERSVLRQETYIREQHSS